jgi:hypothetical protein
MKRTHPRPSLVVVGAVALCASASCASSTLLQTEPPGATVSINGRLVGSTPYQLSDKKIYSKKQLHFELPGYQPLDVTLKRGLHYARPSELYPLAPLDPAQAPGGPAPIGPAGYPLLPPGYPPPAGSPPPGN